MLEAALEKRTAASRAALLIEVDDDEVIRRLSGRRVCPKNGHLYHVEFDPPKNGASATRTARKLVQRDDDKAETVQHRLEVFHEQTSPLIDHYEEQGILRRFDGTRAPGEVHDHIRATLATLDSRRSSSGERRGSDYASSVIVRKTPEEIEEMAAAGRVLARCLNLLRGKARAGVTTGELDEAAEKFIRSQGGVPCLQGLPRLPRARSARRRTRWSFTASRAPTSSSAATCSRSTSA